MLLYRTSQDSMSTSRFADEPLGLTLEEEAIAIGGCKCLLEAGFALSLATRRQMSGALSVVVCEHPALYILRPDDRGSEPECEGELPCPGCVAGTSCDAATWIPSNQDQTADAWLSRSSTTAFKATVQATVSLGRTATCQVADRGA